MKKVMFMMMALMMFLVFNSCKTKIKGDSLIGKWEIINLYENTINNYSVTEIPSSEQLDKLKNFIKNNKFVWEFLENGSFNNYPVSNFLSLTEKSEYIWKTYNINDTIINDRCYSEYGKSLGYIDVVSCRIKQYGSWEIAKEEIIVTSYTIIEWFDYKKKTTILNKTYINEYKNEKPIIKDSSIVKILLEDFKEKEIKTTTGIILKKL